MAGQQPHAIHPNLRITSVLSAGHWLYSKAHTRHPSHPVGYPGHALPSPSPAGSPGPPRVEGPRRLVPHLKATGPQQMHSRLTQSHVQRGVGEEQVTDTGPLELIVLGSTLDTLVMSGVETETQFKPFVSTRPICNISGLYFKALYAWS